MRLIIIPKGATRLSQKKNRSVVSALTCNIGGGESVSRVEDGIGLFCPKCGLQNADASKFCRGCGADLSNVLATVVGKVPADLTVAEKQIDLYGRGLIGLIAGFGFLVVAGVSFGISIRLAVLGVFALAFAFVFLGTGISRMFQAKALRRLREQGATDQNAAALPTGHVDYIEPARSSYETDDLIPARPQSVTEQTTAHLKMHPGKE